MNHLVIGAGGVVGEVAAKLAAPACKEDNERAVPVLAPEAVPWNAAVTEAHAEVWRLFKET